MTTFSEAVVLRDGNASRKETIQPFMGDIDDYAHASIWHHYVNLELFVDARGPDVFEDVMSEVGV